MLVQNYFQNSIIDVCEDSKLNSNIHYLNDVWHFRISASQKSSGTVYLTDCSFTTFLFAVKKERNWCYDKVRAENSNSQVFSYSEKFHKIHWKIPAADSFFIWSLHFHFRLYFRSIPVIFALVFSAPFL